MAWMPSKIQNQYSSFYSEGPLDGGLRAAYKTPESRK